MDHRHNRTTGGGSRTGSPSVAVVGDDAARGVATRLADSATVQYLSDDEHLVQQAANQGLAAESVDVTDVGSLCAAAGDDLDAAVVSLDPDRTALLTAQSLRTTCDVEHVIVCVSETAYRDAFEDTELRIVDAASLLTGAIREKLPLADGDA